MLQCFCFVLRCISKSSSKTKPQRKWFLSDLGIALSQSYRDDDDDDDDDILFMLSDIIKYYAMYHEA